MATIGLDSLYYATITENDDGEETYATPERLAKAISAELSVEVAEAILYADDGPAEVVKEFQSGTLTLGVDDLTPTVAAALVGAVVDKNKVLVSASEDGGAPVAIGFRARKADGTYRYFWLYKVRFAIPAASLNTKGDSIEFATPSIEGTILRRTKPDASGKHPWKAEATEGDATKNITDGWFKNVYEPAYATTTVTAS
ncbi:MULTISPECIES: major tail protein [Actinomycetaceae]|uniref:Phi13 family phage major tail protein n=1 Tax=Trueperella abortisuis TaxID=445930 RepID=A0ABT9PJD3_9ACTO|nr:MULTISPECIES: major tail protein [Actinomycetaceae]MCI7305522.1 phage tail protein [Trueperella sp.]MCI7456928.1 phage tail protein [Actinomyces urogenitalis]MDP9832828.1 phi13 family phage major tail protein [Trueperella abortisuis]